MSCSATMEDHRSRWSKAATMQDIMHKSRPPGKGIGILQSATGTYDISAAFRYAAFNPPSSGRLTLHRRDSSYETAGCGPGSYFTITEDPPDAMTGLGSSTTTPIATPSTSDGSIEDVTASNIPTGTSWHDLPLEIRHQILRHHLKSLIRPTSHTDQAHPNTAIIVPQSLVQISYRVSQDLQYPLQTFLAALKTTTKSCDDMQASYYVEPPGLTALQMEEHKAQWKFWGEEAYRMRVLIKWAAGEARLADEMWQRREDGL